MKSLILVFALLNLDAGMGNGYSGAKTLSEHATLAECFTALKERIQNYEVGTKLTCAESFKMVDQIPAGSHGWSLEGKVPARPQPNVEPIPLGKTRTRPACWNNEQQSYVDCQ